MFRWVLFVILSASTAFGAVAETRFCSDTDATRDRIELVKGDDMRKDYFGRYCPTTPGHLGYHWRQTFWHPAEKMVYGVHGNSGYLFRFDPRAGHIQVLQRLTSEPSQRAGMYDQFSYGYLGFTLGPDGRTIYYLTGGPVYVDGRRVIGKPATGKGESNLELLRKGQSRFRR